MFFRNDAVGVVAFAYDIYTIPRKNNGVLGATLTLDEFYHNMLWRLNEVHTQNN